MISVLSRLSSTTRIGGSSSVMILLESGWRGARDPRADHSFKSKSQAHSDGLPSFRESGSCCRSEMRSAPFCCHSEARSAEESALVNAVNYVTQKQVPR